MARILLIDDEEVVVSCLGDFLRGRGHDITTARNGAQAIQLLENHEYDIVITDIVMPEKDGFELILWLEQQRHIPKIIVITGGSVSVDINLLVQTSRILQADRILVKPIIFSELTQAINEVLQIETGVACPVNP